MQPTEPASPYSRIGSYVSDGVSRNSLEPQRTANGSNLFDSRSNGGASVHVARSPNPTSDTSREYLDGANDNNPTATVPNRLFTAGANGGGGGSYGNANTNYVTDANPSKGNGAVNNASNTNNVSYATPAPAPAASSAEARDGETIPVQARDYVNVDVLPVSTAGVGHQIKPWHYGLCHCCQNCDSCLEAWFCLTCQSSRQCNMVMNGKAKMHWPFCLFMFITDCVTGGTIVTAVFVCWTRDLVRKRYGIDGSSCGDCCTAWCCRACSVQQMLLEMTVNGDFPGATCYDVAAAPMSPRGGVAMV